jgi:hypothetical protein
MPQVFDRQIVVLHAARIARAAGHDDADLRDQSQPCAQAWTCREGRADQRVGAVAAVDVGEIEGVDAGIERGFEQVGHRRGRQSRAPLAEAHGAEDRRGVVHSCARDGRQSGSGR